MNNGVWNGTTLQFEVPFKKQLNQVNSLALQ